MAEKVEIHVWYVCPKDSHTNQVFSGILEEDFDKEYFEYVGSLVCADGRKREFYRCRDHSALAYLEKCRVDARLDFTVYVQCENGKPRPWVFPKKKNAVGKVLALKAKRLKAGQANSSPPITATGRCLYGLADKI